MEQRVLPDPQVEPTITIERAGQILRLSRSCAYKAAQTGELPVIRMGRRLFVPTAKFLELLGHEVNQRQTEGAA